MRKLVFFGCVLAAVFHSALSAPSNPASGVRCALLFSESNMQFAKSAPWTRGPAGYSNLLASVRDALAARGLAVDFITEDDLARDRLQEYRVLYIVDTISITADSESAIRRFVTGGGVLVGVNEVGRFQGGWCNPWRYEDLFGLQALKIDLYDTALSESPDLFHQAVLTSNGTQHVLTRGLPPTLDFGPRAEAIWATRPTTATVLAEFPRYVKTPKEEGRTSEEIEEPVVAVSVHDFGRGKAVWIAVNMHGRQPDAWPETGHTLELLMQSTNLAATELSIPERPVEVYLGLSQLGYAPEETKKAIVRVPQENELPFNQATYALFREGETNAVREGALTLSGPDNRWRDYYYSVDFSDLREEGSYRFEASLSGRRGEATVRGGPFRIAPRLWTSVVEPEQYRFFEAYRCGEKCHRTDPIRGGYHDAAGDYGVRMWSMPHVVYGLAENLRATAGDPDRETHLKELEWAVDWMLRMQDSDGTVWLSVKPTDEMSPIDRRPPNDPTQRILEKGFNLNYQLTYIAGMGHAAQVLKASRPELAARVLAAATNACRPLAGRNWAQESTAEAGNYLWACLELFQASGDEAFLRQARTLAPIILARQSLDGRHTEGSLHGDFFDQAGKTSFGNKQYKKFHCLGTYIGLVELARLLPSDDALRQKVIAALDLYFQEHLLRGAALTPYGQMITGLEPNGNSGFKLYVFTHLESWVRLHGLNCDHFAFAYVALRYAELTGEPSLRAFAQAQAQWVVGMNPFGFGMIDFLGWQQPPIIDDKLGTGRMPGGIPNGIVGNLKDQPAWGSTWDSREYWVPHNAYLLALIPHLDAAAP